MHHRFNTLRNGFRPQSQALRFGSQPTRPQVRQNNPVLNKLMSIFGKDKFTPDLFKKVDEMSKKPMSELEKLPGFKDAVEQARKLGIKL